MKQGGAAYYSTGAQVPSELLLTWHSFIHCFIFRMKNSVHKRTQLNLFAWRLKLWGSQVCGRIRSWSDLVLLQVSWRLTVPKWPGCRQHCPRTNSDHLQLYLQDVSWRCTCTWHQHSARTTWRRSACRWRSTSWPRKRSETPSRGWGPEPSQDGQNGGRWGSPVRDAGIC